MFGSRTGSGCAQSARYHWVCRKRSLERKGNGRGSGELLSWFKEEEFKEYAKGKSGNFLFLLFQIWVRFCLDRLQAEVDEL